MYFKLRKYNFINCTFKLEFSQLWNWVEMHHTMLCVILRAETWKRPSSEKQLRCQSVMDGWVVGRGEGGGGSSLRGVGWHLLPPARRSFCRHPGSFPHSCDTWPCWAWAGKATGKQKQKKKIIFSFIFSFSDKVIQVILRLSQFN